jgi:dynein heavy chain
MESRDVRYSPELKKTSRLAKLSGREGEHASTAMFSLGRTSSHSHFKTLYQFDTDRELAEWELPIAEKPSKPTGATLSRTMLPPIKKVPEPESDDEREGQRDAIDITVLKKMLAADQTRKKATGVRDTLFISMGSQLHKEIMKYTTGEDAISFFAKNGSNTPIKFLHAAKSKVKGKEFRPYDLKIMKETDLPPDYYTISAQGVVHVCPKHNESGSTTTFYSLSDWMHQSKMFNLLSSLKFFKFYLHTKVFALWRANVHYNHFFKTRERLKHNLFLTKPAFAPSMVEINSLLNDMSNAKMLEIKETHRAVDIGEYENQQREQRIEVKKHFDGIVEKLIIVVKRVCDAVRISTNPPELEDLENARLGQQNKKKSMVAQREEEEARKRHLDLARENLSMLGYYIRLVDYQILEQLVSIVRNNLSRFYDEMQIDRKERIFETKVVYSGDNIIFLPNEESFHESVDLIIDGIISDLSKVVRVGYQPEFMTFIKGEHITVIPDIIGVLNASNSFKKLRTRMQRKVEIDFASAKVFVNDTFAKARDIYDYLEQWDFEIYRRDEHTIQSIKDEMGKLKEWKDVDIPRYLPAQPPQPPAFKGMIKIDGKKVRANASNKNKEALDDLLNYLKDSFKSKAGTSNEELSELIVRLKQQPSTLGDFVNYMVSVKESDVKLRNFESVKLQVDDLHTFLKREKVNRLAIDFSPMQDEMAQNIEEFKEVKVAAAEFILTGRGPMEEKLAGNVNKMKDQLTEVFKQLDEGNIVKVEANPDEALKELRRIEQKLEKCKKNGQKYKQYQEILEVPQTRIIELEEATRKFEDKRTLWKMKQEWTVLRDEWFNKHFPDLDTEEVAKKVRGFDKDIKLIKNTLSRLNKDVRDPVSEDMFTKIQEVNAMIGVISDLGNKALRNRHWIKIFACLEGNVTYVAGRTFNLDNLISWGVLKIKDKVEEISGTATGENSLETTLEEIKKIWGQTNFTLAKHRDSADRFVITAIDDTLTQLEEHQVSIQTMLCSRHVQDIKGSIEEWDKRLRYVQKVIDEWLSCQKQWVYLENIFAAPDIQKQLPAESAKFAGVDKFWREMMLKTNKNPSVIDSCSTEGMLERFKKNNLALDEVKKSLDEYLETKRVAFSRFYFLADEELLEILSQTRNPRTVQKHIQKCFENIGQLQFGHGDESTEIVGMISGDKEVVPFSSTVNAVGNVEFWLCFLEGQIKTTLFDNTKRAIAIYPKDGIIRRHWLFSSDLPAQCILTVDQVMWTFKATQAIEEAGQGLVANAVGKFEDFCSAQIDHMVELVRENLTGWQRTLMGALIVLDVHGRDVVTGLKKHDVKSVHDFEWSKQLRYYWDSEIDNCVAKQTVAKFVYGYEYLGNGPRLVITPLTDKCYMTLTGALHLYYGGAPAGPAGTGKTETTKDLGKALAIQCVVFNCSDGLEVTIMARLFSGLAQAGAWSCFDEFNRINIEVLSVIAQQMMTIQQAIRSKSEEFEFNGKYIKLNPRFGVFITMNPGYAGRTELPDNLKSLFRPVAMMIPDYGLIAEIFMFSEGFNNARNLARKMVQLYKLASEQLSKQKHYDFGMRAVKSVLVMAGQLKRREPDMDEDILLIRAMRDSNVPKFLEQDLPLFRGIIQDLFPGVTVPFIDYGSLKLAIENQLVKAKKQAPDSFVTKIIQLLETMLVRHGNMLVGMAATGKTTVYHILAAALTQLHDDSGDQIWHQKVNCYALNPKAITEGELYGAVSRATGDFTDGIVPIIVRTAKDDTSLTKKWIVFDGPVDAVWIESMNTVLDDNKMLCLVNGERIKLPDTITMLFEVQDLDKASPATVSRCGMVYIEPAHLGWRSIVDSWGTKLAEKLPSFAEDVVINLKKLTEKLLTFIREECREEIVSVDLNLVQSALNLVNSQVNPEVLSKKRPEDAELLMKQYLIFSLIWSLGANLNDRSRVKFDQQMRFQMEVIYRDFPYEGSVYDYCIDDDICEFVPWTTRVPSYTYDSKLPFFNILVPTVDTVKYKYLLDSLCRNNCHVLFSGNTGVGKSVIVSDYISNKQNTWFEATSANFSAQTSTHNLNDMLEDKLGERKKTLLGPKTIGKKLIFFVDDVNMPALEEYGAQPPIELLRQVIEGGFYDLKKYFFKNVIDVIFVAACAPPGGGRNPVTQRLFRHFNMIWQPQLSQDSMELIFSNILRGFLDDQPDGLLSYLAEPIVKSSVQTYLKICNDLLPTPSKSHYVFNLRDLSKVIQGILQVAVDSLKTPDTLVLLWVHESCRVFRDRLIDDRDREWFNNQLESRIRENLMIEINRSSWENVLFGDYMDDIVKDYVQVEYGPKLFERLTYCLEKYNSEYSNQMSLVFFKDAIAHLSRIARVLRQPRGNALLVGVGGSGRQSLARLAISMANYKMFSIEITRNYGSSQFRENLKQLLITAGADNLPIVFLFNDSQIVSESFLEDINNILNTGEVPNLFEQPELEDIQTKVGPLAKEAGKSQARDVILAHYVQLVRENLHIILAFSPVGESFRTRCRQFPSIINCCTIDWYNLWPDDALYSVAQRFFSENAELGVIPFKDQLSRMCVEIHTSVIKKSDEFYKELRRKNYTTPTSYLELIRLYLIMLRQQQTIVPQKINRYKVGLQRLRDTNSNVSTLQVSQRELQPILEQKRIMNAQLKEELKVKQAEAKIQEESCSKDEAECSEKLSECSAINEDCQRQIDEAEPILLSAQRAVQQLEKAAITEMRGYSAPHEKVALVANAVCIIFDKPLTWDGCRKLMGEMDFQEQCKQFKPKNLTIAKSKKLKKYTEDPSFNRASIESYSFAAGILCEWVCAIDAYSKVEREVEPKRIKLANAQKELKAAQDILSVKQAELKAVKDMLAELSQNLENSIKEGEELEQKSALTAARLIRAEKLVSLLGGEASRWQKTADMLAIDLENLIGNIIIAAAFISYLGPFTLKYRTTLQESWIRFLKKQGVPVASDFSLERILADPVQIREWTLSGLPADQLSKDNAIIITTGRRWPLIIDPQGQANRWIKNLGGDSNKTIKLSDPGFLKTLENGIRFGNPVLLENIEEKLDPSLEPVLLKQTFKKGGVFYLRLGDQEVPYTNDFRFYITTKLPNPHYLPEICIKVTIVNFTVTPLGLEDQLLVDVVKAERPDLEAKKNELIVNISNDKDQLQGLEDKILKLISETKGEILDNVGLIDTLADSKSMSEIIGERMKGAEETAKEIDITRETYRIVATRGSVLYFVIADIGLVDPMYQYSLEFFTKLFNTRLVKAQKSDIIEQRLRSLIDDITRSFYINICRGLFEKDKLLYSFLNTVRISITAGAITPEEWAFFIRGNDDKSGSGLSSQGLELSSEAWNSVKRLEAVHVNFAGVCDSFKKDAAKWLEIVNSNEPFEQELPSPYEARLSNFQKLLLGSTLKEEKLVSGVKVYITRELGDFFIESPPFDLRGAFEDSHSMNPIIFVLSPGADPISDLMKLAKEMEMTGPKFRSLSLGRGQGKAAEKYIDNGRRNGDWVCLQNCHLAASWMSDLERIQEQQVEGDTHADYRLWLTSMPSTKFPVPVLQSGIKLTNEPPKGLRANMQRTFLDITSENFESCSKNFEYKKLLFSLAFFHAVILERRKFGAIGWNIPYEWMTSDFATCQSQLMLYLDTQPDVPYQTLRVIVSEINYGGRVTDDKDVRLITALLSKYFTPEVMQTTPLYSFSNSGIYFSPPVDNVESVKNYILSLPLDDEPEVFGLHANANITFSKKTVREFRETLTSISPAGASAGSGKSPDEIVTEMAAEINGRLPKVMDMKGEQHPETFAITADGSMNSMGVFIGQEIVRFNKLLQIMKKSLEELQKAIRGDVVMSLELEQMYTNFLIQKVPAKWVEFAYPSLKPLASWVNDLIERIAFVREWLSQGPRPCYWLSSFFFPQGFMTATLQIYARETKLAIDSLKFRTEVINMSKEQVTLKPKAGVNIYGLFMQGARWDWNGGKMAESEAKVLFIEMPVIWLEPILIETVVPGSFYNSPLYKTSLRAGELSTTGHSTNFVLYLELRTEEEPVHWIRRGVALLCQLDD